MLYNWNTKNNYQSDDPLPHHGISRQAPRILDKYVPSNNTPKDESDEVLSKSLKQQTQKVSDTLSNLKKLEQRRKMEIEALRKTREDADKLKRKLEKKEEKREMEEKRLAQLELELKLRDAVEEKRKIDSRPNTESGSRASGRSLTEDQKKEIFNEFLTIPGISSDTENTVIDLEKFEESEDTVFEDSTDEEEESPVDDRVSNLAQNLLSKDLSEMKLNDLTDLLRNPDTAMSLIENGDEESLMQLEDQINGFHNKFKDLFSQMSGLKQRLRFYQEHKREVSSDEPNGPEGIVTLVFTDVQDSTRLWELDLDVMAESIKIHNEIMRNLLQETNGFEVKTEGDAFMCAFSNVHDAVEFVLRGQVALIEADWPEKLLELEPGRIEFDAENTLVYRGLRVRMGMHTGQPIVQKDPVTKRNDYFGPVVNRAARVEGQAAGGQIIISGSVWSEIEDQLESGYSMKVWTKPIGQVVLKGMDEPETITLILPHQLRNRTFATAVLGVDDSSSMREVEDKLRLLSEDHERLEAERELIHNQIQYKLKIKALEDTMNEKDKVIKYLKSKLELVKKNYQEAIRTNDDKKKMEFSSQSRQLQKDIETVMAKYETMRSQYTQMRESYDDVVKVFNRKLKFELDGFKDDLKEMSEQVKVERDQSEDWNIEKVEYQKQLEIKERIIEEKDDKISRLQGELAISQMNHKVEHVKNILKKDVPNSVFGGRKGSLPARLIIPDRGEYIPRAAVLQKKRSLVILPNPNDLPMNTNLVNTDGNTSEAPMNDVVTKQQIYENSTPNTNAATANIGRKMSILQSDHGTPLSSGLTPQYVSQYSEDDGRTPVRPRFNVLDGYNGYDEQQRRNSEPYVDPRNRRRSSTFRGFNNEGTPVFVDDQGVLLTNMVPDQTYIYNNETTVDKPRNNDSPTVVVTTANTGTITPQGKRNSSPTSTGTPTKQFKQQNNRSINNSPQTPTMSNNHTGLWNTPPSSFSPYPSHLDPAKQRVHFNDILEKHQSIISQYLARAQQQYNEGEADRITESNFTVSDLTTILKEAIKDAVSTARRYKKFDWKMYIKGKRVKHVDNINILPNSYLRKLDTTSGDLPRIQQNQTLKIWNDHKQESISMTVDDLRKWGMMNATKLVPQAQVKNKVMSPAPAPSTKQVAPQDKTKVSYSRMLETFGEQRRNSRNTQAEDFISQWDPLGSPFRRVKKQKASPQAAVPTENDKTREEFVTNLGRSHSAPLREERGTPVKDNTNTIKWSELSSHNKQPQQQDRGLLLPEIKYRGTQPDTNSDTKRRADHQPPRGTIGLDASKEERRAHILKMLSYDRNNQNNYKMRNSLGIRESGYDYPENVTVFASGDNLGVFGKQTKNIL
jgi:class 3 adenylate cyclase